MNSSSILSFPFTSDASPKTKISTGTQTFLTINDFSNISSTDALMSNDDYVNKFFNSSNTPIEESIGNKKNGKSLKTAIKTDAFELFRKEYIKSNPEKEEKDIVLVWDRLESNIRKIYVSNAENERKKSKGKN